MSEFYREYIVKKTRKRHRCDWCGIFILIGSRCAYHAGKWDGDLFSGHIHLECAAARNSAEWVRDEGYEEGAQVRGRTDDDAQAAPEFTEEDYFKK